MWYREWWELYLASVRLWIELASRRGLLSFYTLSIDALLAKPLVSRCAPSVPLCLWLRGAAAARCWPCTATRLLRIQPVTFSLQVAAAKCTDTYFPRWSLVKIVQLFWLAHLTIMDQRFAQSTFKVFLPCPKALCGLLNMQICHHSAVRGRGALASLWMQTVAE